MDVCQVDQIFQGKGWLSIQVRGGASGIPASQSGERDLFKSSKGPMVNEILVTHIWEPIWSVMLRNMLS